ncbi:hypothetical protein DV736_g6685, partial [Chaetothyriales sp. CBS 134916]
RANSRDVPDTNDKPDLTNLYAYGCKVYPLKESILRGADRVQQRTSARTHLGYLVGYEGRNIYRIWIPSKDTVIRTRDVIFNESQFYNSAAEVVQQNIEIELDVESDIGSTIVAAVPVDQDDNPQESTTADEITTDKGISHSVAEENPYPTPDQSRQTTPQTGKAPIEQPIEMSEDLTTVESSNQRPLRNRYPTARALENLESTGSAFQSGFATAPLLSSFHAGLQYSIHRRDLPPEPRTWKELQNHPYKAEFTAAIKQEWDNICAMKTIQFVNRNEARSRPLPLTWVFKYKFDKQGYLHKFKARICVRGDLQPISDKEIYAATLAAKSFRILMALAARWDLEIKQLDTVNAFPNSELDEEVYIELPDGFKQRGIIGRLLRALYGLRRSPLLWQKLLSKVLIELGLQQAAEEPCLFINDWLIVFFFVDDIVSMYRQSDTEKAVQFTKQLTGHFQMRDLGDLRWFLGIRVARDREKRLIWLSQDSYIENIAVRFALDKQKGYPSTPLPIEPLESSLESADDATVHLYQRKIGSIMYAAVITRPDVAQAAAKLARFLTNPSSAHMEAANRCIQYLYRTRELGIRYDGEQTDGELAVYTDASFADDTTDRKSSQGYLMTLYGGPIAWKAGKQATVTTSSTEAELLALTAVSKEAVATIRLFAEMRYIPGDKLRIRCDNRQTIRLVNSELPRLQTALRHVDIHSNWARQEVQNGTFTVEYLPTAEMPADGLTKALPKVKFRRFVALLPLHAAPKPLEDDDEASSSL